MINSTPKTQAQIEVIIARIDSEIAEYRQDLKSCQPSDKVQITLLKTMIENANEKLSRWVKY